MTTCTHCRPRFTPPPTVLDRPCISLPTRVLAARPELSSLPAIGVALVAAAQESA